VALFRATAGLWEAGAGRIVRPPAEQIMFVPERPYLPPGTLREVVLRTKRESGVPEQAIAGVLRALGLEAMLARVGGLDVERDWDDVLSLGEQQLLSVARVRLAAPAFAVLQSLGTTLAPEQVASSLRLLSDASITCLAIGKTEGSPDPFDAVLELRAAGAWSWRLASPSQGVA
jgi:putative ATP-binding cassette transporter